MSSGRSRRGNSGEGNRDYVDYQHYSPGGVRDRDSRDSHHGGSDKQKPVPGLVSDPDAHLREIERVIQRGQRESIFRTQSNSYSGVRATQDTLTEYRPAVPAIGHSYYRPSLKGSFNKYKGPTRINPGFLAFLPGLAGLGLLTAAIVLVAWSLETDEVDLRAGVTSRGLFQQCFHSDNTTLSCELLKQFSVGSSSYSDIELLGQATRGLVIIAAGVSLITVVACVVLGINKCARSKGTLVIGSLFAVAGASGAGGMGCYTALLVNIMEFQTGRNVVPGHSVYLGWAGTLCLLIASIIAFLAHCARPK